MTATSELDEAVAALHTALDALDAAVDARLAAAAATAAAATNGAVNGGGTASEAEFARLRDAKRRLESEVSGLRAALQRSEEARAKAARRIDDGMRQIKGMFDI